MLPMEQSRIGAALRAARERRGWSRETLAHHSGVSWSAIAQIESGRRKDVRLSSLAALADALAISVDHLIGTAATIRAPLLEHRVLAYGSDDELLAGIAPFLAEGVERGECVLAVTTRTQIGVLRAALDDRASAVEFVDSADWYRSPTAAFSRYGTFLKEKLDAGAPWIRIVGEPIWAGRTAGEIAAWTRYESMINLSFASSPATIMCPYDLRTAPDSVVADALRTHPQVAHASGTTTSPGYREPADLLLDPYKGIA